MTTTAFYESLNGAKKALYRAEYDFAISCGASTDAAHLAAKTKVENASKLVAGERFYH